MNQLSESMTKLLVSVQHISTDVQGGFTAEVTQSFNPQIPFLQAHTIYYTDLFILKM